MFPTGTQIGEIKKAMKEYLPQHTKKDSPAALLLPAAAFQIGVQPQSDQKSHAQKISNLTGTQKHQTL